MLPARRQLSALPSHARRCLGEGCGLRVDCLRHRDLDSRPSGAPLLDNACNYEEERPAFLLASQSGSGA